MTQRIKLLGTLAIEEDGRRPLEARGKRLMNSVHGLALVSYLLYCNEIQSREQVADLLWEASSTSRSLMRLRELLARVRRYLPQVQASRMTVTFRAGADDVIDLFLLREGLASEDMAQLDEALRLYEGDFLASFHLPGAPMFNEWLVVVREQLRVAVLDAHHRLCQHYAAARQWRSGVDVARRWVALEPLDEVAHRWLMHLLARNGQVTAALRAYEACRQIVAQQLGIEPQAETCALARQLESWHRGTATSVAGGLTFLTPLASGEPSPPAPLPPHAILPHRRNPHFVGREAELLQIAKVLGQATSDERRAAAALTGIGGVGKTQTAVEFCYRYGRYFPGGVFWIRFDDTAAVAQEVAFAGSQRGLGLFLEAERLSPAERTARVQRAWQEPTPRLLVFDDCNDEDLLAQWLPVSGGCCVLLTGRRTGWARALGVTEVALHPPDPCESANLLQQLANHLSAEECREIAALLGHLPLALYLAGSFLHRYRHIAPATFAQQLRDGEPLQHPALRGRGVRYSPTGHVLDVAQTYAPGWLQLDPADEVDAMARRLLAYAARLPAGKPIAVVCLKDAFNRHDAGLGYGLLLEDALSRLVSSGFLTRGAGQTVVLHPLQASFTRIMETSSCARRCRREPA